MDASGSRHDPDPADLQAELRRVRAELADLQARTGDAEHLAQMGSYDWHIPTDTLRWSDELFRIYGHEPQSFSPRYEMFLSFIHPDDRERISALHEHAYTSGEPYRMVERIVRPDGEVRHLSSNGEVFHDASGVPVRLRGTCVDITDRVRAEHEREEAAARLGEVTALRRTAMELNDNVVQGLAAALLALEDDEQEDARERVSRTLAAARAMMEELLDPADPGGTLQPGDLVRERPAVLGPTTGAPAGAAPGFRADRNGRAQRSRTVLLVDDAEDLRDVFRLKLERHDGYQVVGEAGDGITGVELARQLQPDLVLLDLAMPRMDGLEALPLIREAAPDACVVVLSGFDERTMADKAMAAGARSYVVKGGSLKELVGVLDSVCG